MITTIQKYFGMFAFIVVLTLASAGVAHADMWADADTAITALKTSVEDLLPAIFAVVLVFVGFKLLRRGTNKV